MKYYLFLLFLVLGLSYQNCEGSSSGSAGTTLIDGSKDERGLSTDTGNGGDSTEPKVLKEQIDNLTAVICNKNRDFTGDKTQDCIDALLLDIKYYNGLTFNFEHTTVDEFYESAENAQLELIPGNFSECFTYAYHLNLEGYKAGDDIIAIILEYPYCQKAIMHLNP